MTDTEFTATLTLDTSYVNELVNDLRRKGWDDIAKELRRQIPIDEPGVWGVVEAHTKGSGLRRNLGRIPKDDEWRWTDGDDYYRWADLLEPTLIREGL